ncbi:hypothetical protein ACFOLD_08310 [Kocuria carniphila]|uniref:hypothetical protein n=1 Tax=Kocuria carniphila TaxID=262208 RepID=UPI003609B0CE
MDVAGGGPGGRAPAVPEGHPRHIGLAFTKAASRARPAAGSGHSWCRRVRQRWCNSLASMAMTRKVEVPCDQ